MPNIQISLENYPGQYHPGETICGRVRCIFDSETRFRAIKVRFRGKGRVTWKSTEYTTDRRNRQHQKVVNYFGENVFLGEEMILRDAPTGKEVLKAGQHEFPFSYTLPSVLPGSFNHTYGGIIYKIKAVVDRPWRFDHESEVTINVVSPINLNNYPTFKDPCILTEKKDMYSGISNAGTLSYTVSLPFRGFVPGVPVRFGVDVKNLSNISVKEMTYKITKDITFTSKTPRRQNKTVSQIIYCGGTGAVGANGEHQFFVEMTIPKEITAENFSSCDLFSVNYTFEVTAIPKGLHFNLTSSTNVLVGHIPITTVPFNPLPQPPVHNPYPPAPYQAPGFVPQPQGPYPEVHYPQQPPPPYSPTPPANHGLYPTLPPAYYSPGVPSGAPYAGNLPPVVEGVQSRGPSAPNLGSEKKTVPGVEDGEDFVMLEK